MRQGFRYLLLLAVASGVAVSHHATPEAIPTAPIKIIVMANPDDAVRLALADILTIHPYHRRFQRYVFIPDASIETMKTTSLEINRTISRATIIIRPLPVAKGYLLRLDLRRYAPVDQDFRELLNFWEELRFDPTFSLLLTKDLLLRFKIPRPGKRTRHFDYESAKWIWEESQTLKEDVLRLDSGGISQRNFSSLVHELHTQAPIVEHNYLKHRITSTIKEFVEDANESKVFTTIFGGLYYDFRGIKKAKDVLGKDTKATDFDLYLESLGIGNIKGGLTADALFDKLRSDQRAATFRSKVTGKTRITQMYNTPSGREGSGWGSITIDIQDKDIDINDLAYANTLRPRIRAREGIFPCPNGLHEYTMFNGKGELQDEVPFNVANDTMIPDPHTKRLEAQSCFGCHCLKGKDGWQPVRNDLKDYLLKRVDIYDDLSVPFRKDSNQSTIDRVAGLYTGDFSYNMEYARDSLARAVLIATGPWQGEGTQADICRKVAQKTYDERKAWRWDAVDAQAVLYDLGLKLSPPDKSQALKVLCSILPPDMRSTVILPDHQPIVLEDPRIAAILSGGEINRFDYLLSYSFILQRVSKSPVYRVLREGKVP